MIVRAATQEDAPSIARVHLDSRRKASGHLFDATYLASLSVDDCLSPWQERLRQTHRRTLIAEVAGEAQGFARFGTPGEFSPAEDAGLLDFLYVAPDFWRQGLGSALLAAAEGGLRAQQFTSAFLAVYEENHLARASYERKGWTFDGTRWQIDRNGPLRSCAT